VSAVVVGPEFNVGLTGVDSHAEESRVGQLGLAKIERESDLLVHPDRVGADLLG
jgi:hypothetical protein